MYKTKSGSKLDISKCREIAAGGEGRILEHPQAKDKVVKIYHIPRKPDFGKHLEMLSKLPPAFISPKEIYYDSNGSCAGFDMKYVKFSDYFLFNNLFNKGFCSNNKITKAFKVKVLEQLRVSLEILHHDRIVIGDLNQYNLFFSKKGDLVFVDVDSYQSPQVPHSGVLLDEIRDWTTRDINAATDSWAYDILAFWITTYVHPFKWVAKGNAETLEQRVRAKKSILARIPDIKIPVLYEPPDATVWPQFEDVFGPKARRYMVMFDGGFIAAPAIVKQPVHSTSLNVREIYTGVTEMYATHNMFTVRCQDGWHQVEANITGIIRDVFVNKDCDILYPTQSSVIGNVLIIKTDMKTYNAPSFYFNDGYLGVLDYTVDMLYNYDLTDMQFGVPTGMTPVFAKSFIFRNAPIQNFGGTQYLNIPYKNRYTLVQMPKGVKDAVFTRGWYVAECRLRTKTRYVIGHMSGIQAEFDYLPFFAVKHMVEGRQNYDLLFVPDNGHINVYKDLQLVTTLDMANCTQNSKIFSTQAGLLLLENSSLFLLNTK